MVKQEMMRGSGHDDSLCINVVVATARNSNSVRSGTYTGEESLTLLIYGKLFVECALRQ